jgi:hypothetical protein
MPASPFGLSAVPVGNRLMIGVPMDAAGQAVAWAGIWCVAGFGITYAAMSRRG